MHIGLRDSKLNIFFVAYTAILPKGHITLGVIGHPLWFLFAAVHTPSL